jgi:ribosomal-protein-alanine N-acetyltransferase
MKINFSVFDHFPLLHTKRLELRAIGPENAAEILDMRSSKRVSAFIARDPIKDLHSAEELIKRTQKNYQNQEGFAWGAHLTGTDELIGSCGLFRFDLDNFRAEIGGEMRVQYWGRRYALEGVEAITEFGFNEFGLHSIDAWVNPDNRSAIYLLEQLGYRKEAHFSDRVYFKGKFQDMAVYTKIA